jgi:hypothetical protein
MDKILVIIASALKTGYFGETSPLLEHPSDPRQTCPGRGSNPRSAVEELLQQQYRCLFRTPTIRMRVRAHAQSVVDPEVSNSGK